MRWPVRVGGKVVGVVEDGVLVLRRDPNRHLYRAAPGPGWAVSLKVLQQAALLGAREVRVCTREASYTTSLQVFKTYGVPLNHADPQLLLPLRAWKVKRHPAQLPLLGPPDAAPAKTRRK